MTESEASSLPTDPLELVLARLEELEKLADRAPWRPDGPFVMNAENRILCDSPPFGADISSVHSHFIAALRNAAPALLALAREAQADVKYGRDRGLSQYVRRPQVYASDLLLYALEELAKLEIP